MYHNLKGDVFRIILKGLLIAKKYKLSIVVDCTTSWSCWVRDLGNLHIKYDTVCFIEIKNSMVRSVLNHQDCDEVLLQDILHKEPGDHSHCGGQTGSTNPVPLQRLLVDICSHYEGRCTLTHTHTHTHNWIRSPFPTHLTFGRNNQCFMVYDTETRQYRRGYNHMKWFLRS